MSYARVENSRHIGLDLSQIQKEEIRADTKIIVNDLSDPFHQFIIHSHYIVLWSASQHFRQTLQFPSNNNSGSGGGNNEIIISLDLSESSGFTERMIRLFFSLFYVPTFTEATLGIEHYEYIEENKQKSQPATLYPAAVEFLSNTLAQHV